MNPYANPTVNYTVNKPNPYTQEELAAMQLQAMQEYMEKEQAYEEAMKLGYGKLPYVLGTIGGTAAGIGAGYGLGKLLGYGASKINKLAPRAENIEAYGKGLGILAGIPGGAYAGYKGVQALEDYNHPGARAAKRQAEEEFFDAENYLEDAGDMDPQMYETLRLKERVRVPRHYKLEEEKAYNQMIADEKRNQLVLQRQQALNNTVQNIHALNSLFSTASFSDRINMMEKVAQDLVQTDAELTAEQEQAVQDYISSQQAINDAEQRGTGLVYQGLGMTGGLVGGGLGAGKLTNNWIEENQILKPYGRSDLKDKFRRMGRGGLFGLGTLAGAVGGGMAGLAGINLLDRISNPGSLEERQRAYVEFLRQRKMMEAQGLDPDQYKQDVDINFLGI